MKEPQPLPLVIAVRLTDPHGGEWHPRLKHEIVNLVVDFPGMPRVIGPNIFSLPVVERIEIKGAIRHFRGEPMSAERRFVTGGDREESAIAFIAANPNEEGRGFRRIPLRKLRHKFLELHPGVKKRQRGWISDRNGGRHTHPGLFLTGVPAHPERLIDAHGVPEMNREGHPERLDMLGIVRKHLLPAQHGQMILRL